VASATPLFAPPKPLSPSALAYQGTPKNNNHTEPDLTIEVRGAGLGCIPMQEGARLLRPVEEEQVAIPSIGNQDRFGAEPRTGADPGVGAVIRAVRGDLGDIRFAVCSKRW
jgi:hypothetical protein